MTKEISALTHNNLSPSPLFKVRETIDSLCQRAHRSPRDVCLIAVSKTKPLESVRALAELGQVDFGENKVQEAQEKFPALKEAFPHLRLHMIGPLQTNKVKDAMAIADAIHSLDRLKLAQKIAAERDRTGKCPDLFVQVNVGEEPQKAGILPSQLAEFLGQVAELNLPLKGLMCIPPQADPPAGHFAFLRKLAERHGLPGLSMGMSADYPAAVELGATHIRVGSALFGARARG